jgi:GH18 family chitinase
MNIKKKNTFNLFFTIILLLGFINNSFAQTCKEIVGYYPNWQWYDRSKLVNPSSIDYSKYSILNYAFFKPEPNGTISNTDTWADENLLLGEMNWTTNTRDFTTTLVYHAQQNGVKILPSVGGWTLSDNIPGISSDPIKRATFAQACVNLISTYQFDGIDLDWEYPGFSTHGGTPQDKVNFTLLLNEIRVAIDNYGSSINKPMLLTIAVGAAPDKMDDVEWNNISQVVDIINLMSYDFFGTFDPITNHNSPLYAPAQGDPEFNVDKSVKRLVNTYNVAPSKITVGVAFYGRSHTTVNAPDLHVQGTGTADNVTFQADQGTPLYYNVLEKLPLFTKHWDSQSEVPYLTGNGNLQTFVSYDDELSIAKKAEYIVNYNLRGAIIWEITGDYLETFIGSGLIKSTPLVDTLSYTFCNYFGPSTDIKIDPFENPNLKIYPNPTTGKITISVLPDKSEIVLMDITGKVLVSQMMTSEKINFDLTSYKSGIYFLTIRNNIKSETKKITLIK